MLQISDYSKSYGHDPVLAIDQHTFNNGCYLIKGSNGSGKTTLFRSIAGLLSFQGNITIDGTHIRKEPVSYRRHVNYCEAEPVFPPFLSARDLSAFVAKAKGATRQQEEELTERLNMGSFIKHATSTYSSGMLKKTSLLLGFLGKPRVILLDEPFTTIDAASLKALTTLITERRNSCIFLISAHQPPEHIPLAFGEQLLITNKKLTFPES